jgi:hypothetical protein
VLFYGTAPSEGTTVCASAIYISKRHTFELNIYTSV